MSREKRFHWLIRLFSKYFTFLLLVAFVITCCTMLFVSALADSLGVVLTNANVGRAAKLTFLNVLLISFVFTVIDTVRRKLTVERPVKRIVMATEKMIKGDFSERVPTVSRMLVDENFNEIIRCINKMAEELSGVETLRTDFVASVSHELKTPLAVIGNYATLLEAPELSDEKRVEYARAMLSAVRRLSDMMTNILKLNRLENQKIYPKSERFNLSEQLCECLLQFEAIWEKRGIAIETEIEEDLFVSGDSELLSLVWNNLLSNAFKFTDDGGSVSLSLAAEGDFAVVKVRDTGCGMTPEVGAHMFEKFYQGDTSRATEGNGLGLALVKRVVDITSGEIAVESTLGVGTVFTVRLKREPSDAE